MKGSSLSLRTNSDPSSSKSRYLTRYLGHHSPIPEANSCCCESTAEHWASSFKKKEGQIAKYISARAIPHQIRLFASSRKKGLSVHPTNTEKVTPEKLSSKSQHWSWQGQINTEKKWSKSGVVSRGDQSEAIPLNSDISTTKVYGIVITLSG